MRKARLVIDFGRSKYRAKAWECATRAQVVSDPQQRAELLCFAGMWLSLTEPTEDDLRGAYEVPPRWRLEDRTFATRGSRLPA